MDKKLIFMGTSEFAVPILKSLHQNGFLVEVVYTQPPQKANRGQKIKKSPIQKISEILNINCRYPQSLLNNSEELQFFKKIEADLAVVVAYGQIIPKKFLNLTKKGFINIHGSILPKWRGAAPIQRAIMNLDIETGISIMRVEEKLDSGPVCNIYKINLDKSQNSEQVSEKLAFLASEKILENVKNVLNDEADFVNQNDDLATYAKKIEKKEGQIKWSDTASKILGKINGLFPNPGAFFYYNGERYKILKAEIGEGCGEIGEVLSNKLEIACGDNRSIKILEIKRQGKKSQKIEEFIPGSLIKKGIKIKYV